jgi:peptide/nickel transport system substrate-binding protein
LVHTYDILDVSYAYPNSRLAPVNDRRVRQAINYAVDRRTVIELSGRSTAYAEPSCQLLPPSMPSYQR